MNDTAKLGAALVGGYLLGRTKKGKLALSVALWLARRRGPTTGGALGGLTSAPEVSNLIGRVRGPLLEAARRAATSAVESRTNALAEGLQQRTSNLLASGGGRSGSGDGDDNAGEERDNRSATPRKAAGPPKAGKAAKARDQAPRGSREGRGTEPRKAPKAAKAAETAKTAKATKTAKAVRTAKAAKATKAAGNAGNGSPSARRSRRGTTQ